MIRLKTTIAISFIFCILLSYNSFAAIVVLNGLTHENTAQPGETYRGTIQIQNAGSDEKGVRVYQRDYWFSYTGQSKHDPAGSMERSNADWITYTPELITLDSSEVTSISFEVKVPDNNSLSGTFWSVIMVEGISTPDTSQVETGVRINTAIRYAIQIVTNIGSTGNSNMEFIGLELSKENDNNVLHVAVENTGERILKPEMNLELFDENGNSAGVIKADPRKTYPGTSILSSLVLEGIKPGNYNGVLVADCGEERLYGTNLTLEIE